ncbi:glyoxalase [Thalassotalea insulae]|uniref:Glyoxalase n=1 Tax=Thalassotalea insulae TaxID=2056778 RepID=A0ABQ6GX48_9GAMM|nr:ArsI/CadI family heavy metal resistance metalloenzyme [Thalassotalea insulae]GLX80523.1 glyoxalase [Thalassotalea insulae]
MKRIHIHIAVNELSTSIGFYSTIFGTSPTVERNDYAKWQLSDPAVNFAISTRGDTIGINHLGMQVDSEEELAEIAQRLDDAEIAYSKQQGASCCYAHSNKHWALDPQEIAWESFHSLGEISTFSDGANAVTEGEPSSCCIPLNISQSSDKTASVCCVPNENDAPACCE